MPPPPPDIDDEQWLATIDGVERRAPARLAPIHLGVFDDVGPHLDAFRIGLARMADSVGRGDSPEEFERPSQEAIPAAERDLDEHAIPTWQCYGGLNRYWDKKREAATTGSDRP